MATETEIALVEQRLADSAARLNAAHLAMVDIVVEAEASAAWAVPGVRSIEQWLAWQAGVSGATARALLRVARGRATHPLVSAKFAGGELSFDQADAATRVQPHHDRDAAQLAPLATVAQLRTLARLSRMPVDPPEPVTLTESLSVIQLDDGQFDVRATLGEDSGRVLRAALDAAKDRLFHGGQPSVTWVDALDDVCRRSLDGEAPARSARFRVGLYLDPTAPVPARWAASGMAAPPWLRRLLTCDGLIEPIFVADAVPLSVGRTQRIVPQRTRRAVTDRDGGVCRVPWCSSRYALDIHHIEHWEDLGDSDTPNLCLLCRCCHRRHHAGEFQITGNADDPDGLSFTDRNGRQIIRPQPRPGTMCIASRPPGGAGATDGAGIESPGDPPYPRYVHPLGERGDWARVSLPPKPAVVAAE